MKKICPSENVKMGQGFQTLLTTFIVLVYIIQYTVYVYSSFINK